MPAGSVRNKSPSRGRAGAFRRDAVAVASVRSLRTPDWLPRPVADYARALIAGTVFPGIALSQRGRLARLTTDPKMQFVWTQLSREMKSLVASGNVNPRKAATVVDAWLHGYLYVAATADGNVGYWKSAPTARERKETMLRIRDSARELIELLDTPLTVPRWTPWDQLTAGLLAARSGPTRVQELCGRLAAATRGRYWSTTENDDTNRWSPLKKVEGPLLFQLGARSLLTGLPQVLEVAASLAELSVGADDEAALRSQPSKTKNLARTVYVRNLLGYAKGLGLRARAPRQRLPGFHLHQIVAITANVALHLADREAIRADTVRKLFAEDH